MPDFHSLTGIEGEPVGTYPATEGGPEATGRAPGSRIELVAGSGRVFHLGWDTEGGDRAGHNLLRAPLRLDVQIAGEWSEVWIPAHVFPTRTLASSEQELVYGFQIVGHLGPVTELLWAIRMAGGGMTMTLACRDAADGAERLGGLRLVFPFDLDLCASTVIAGSWTPSGRAVLPAILSAPDHGEILVRCPRHPQLEGCLDGTRRQKRMDFVLDLPTPDEQGYQLEFAPLRLPEPEALHDPRRWAAARRGWFDLLQVHAEMGARNGDAPSPAGLWANNVISNPVSSLLFLLGDHVLLVPELAPGVSLLPFLRRTLEYWMTKEIAPDGRVYYVENGERGQPVMDANPAVLIAAWSYVEASGDADWLRGIIERLELVAHYMEGRDVDGDGLLESVQTGNSGSHARPDSAWDTFTSGHKNAYVNALAYRAFRCLADLETTVERPDQAAHYSALADGLRSGYSAAFYNPETGWLGWWRSQDGVLHDIHSDVPTSLAIAYGLISAAEGRQMLDAYWKELQQSGFHRFDLGVPSALRPIPRKDTIGDEGSRNQHYFVPQQEDGGDTFGRWLNGGCCVSNTYFFLLANYIAGNQERADGILDAMLKRQDEGVFPNGGGFQNGVVDRMPFGAEFLEWDGKTSGYEGHLVYSWAFLQCVFLRNPAFRARVLRPLDHTAGSPET